MKTKLLSLALLSLTAAPAALACLPVSLDLNNDGKILISAASIRLADADADIAATSNLSVHVGTDSAQLQQNVSVVAQEKDAGGIISTTYLLLASHPAARYAPKKVRITGNYMGNGITAKSLGGCGKIVDVTAEATAPAGGANADHLGAQQNGPAMFDDGR